MKKYISNFLKVLTFKRKKESIELPVEKKNPYELVWYRQGWSDSRVKKNNTKYWKWEIENNNLKLK